MHTTIGSFDTLQAAAYVGITNALMIGAFIYALAPASGGHVNPLITFSTMLTGLTGFSRGVLYMVAQTVGGALAGGMFRGSFGGVLTQRYVGGGCNLEKGGLDPGQAFLIECVLSFVLVFLAFGVGLDPRQKQLLGKLGPALVGMVLGLVSFASVGLAEGYPGAGLNPARCFGAAVARDDFTYQWIWWLGPFVGCLFQAVVYHIAPPYHLESAEERTNCRAN